MARFARYAIYYAPPPESALARLGAAWLGWDAARGEEVPRLALCGLPLPAAELTARPARYGFHATLKAPFRLAEGCDAAALERAAARLAGKLAAFRAPPLRLSRARGFLALVPAAPEPRLGALAARCVAELDGFRAPADEAELARRRAAGLGPRQEALLGRWGYPYVMEEFWFHMTLTGSFDDATLERAEAALAPALDEALGAPLEIDAICLFGEDPAGRFHSLSRLPLAG